MNKLLRALVISAVATGTAMLVLHVVKGDNTAMRQPREKADGFVDAEQLTDEERNLLANELDAML